MSGGSQDLDLADAIEELRAQLLAARERGQGSDVQFPVNKVTVELNLVAKSEGGGRAGFKVPVIGLELGGSGSLTREVTHRVVIEFGEPVDGRGVPIRVDRTSATPLD